MIDIELLRREGERVKKAIATKRADPGMVDTFLELDKKWRQATTALDQLRATQKKLSQERNIEGAKQNKEQIKLNEETVSALASERDAVVSKIPNLPSSDTPVGEDESANVELRQVGEPKQFSFSPKDHIALGEALGIIDTKTASEVSGARFAYVKGDLARLEFALISYTLDTLTNKEIISSIANTVRPGYSAASFIPVVPPVMIRPDVFSKMARLEPKEERYYIPSDDLYLVGSAEHTLGPLHMNETIPAHELPLRYVGFSTSFRREAGSYGKDTKGILRLHQFDKVEMESFVTPENGQAEQDFFVAVQEYLVASLQLPYRVIICSTGDQGDPDARHLDIECWLPGQNTYRETHSADYMTDYQARRLNTKVKFASGTTEFVHMNDATAFAIGRTLIAIMENYQTEQGTIRIPDVLQPYMHKSAIGS